MTEHPFWLNDEAWSLIEPMLPKISRARGGSMTVAS